MPVSAKIFEKNLSALPGERQLAAGLEKIEPYPAEWVELAKSGDPILSLPGEDGTPRPLHSRYQPRDEARRLLPEENDPIATYVLIGAGLGYVALELLERFTPANKLLWLEADPRLFRTMLEHVNIGPVLRHPGLQLLVGGTVDDVKGMLRSEMRDVLAGPVHLIPHAPSFQRQPEVYESYRQALNDFSVEGAVVLKTSMYLSRFTFKNQTANLVHYLSSPGIAPLKGTLAGKPAVIISAGPSLRRDIHLLHEAVGKVTLIAVSTTLRPLLDRGIRPDFTVLIDWHRMSRRYFEGVDPATAPLMVCELRATSEGIGTYPGTHLFPNDLYFNTLFEGLFGDKGDLPLGTTVAHSAFHFANYLGADPIILVGQDLAFTGSLLHVPGTVVQTQEYPTTHRFYSLEMRELEFYLTYRKRFRKVPAIPDGEVPTDNVFFSYLKEFERIFREHPGQVIDATEGGARIEGTEVLRLKEVLSRYPDASIPDYPTLIAEAQQQLFVDELRESSLVMLAERRHQLRRLRDLYCRIIPLLEKVLRKNAKGNAADKEVDKVQRLHKQAKEFGRLYLMLQQLAQSDAWERYRQDRRLDVTDRQGVERQQQQAHRDLDYVRALAGAADFLLECLEETRSCIEASATT
ncbi:MAG: 6-hydroxymethylpterin diphosphokinase MptE-like protein [Planctomycetota bacterium]